MCELLFNGSLCLHLGFSTKNRTIRERGGERGAEKRVMFKVSLEDAALGNIFSPVLSTLVLLCSLTWPSHQHLPKSPCFFTQDHLTEWFLLD